MTVVPLNIDMGAEELINDDHDQDQMIRSNILYYGSIIEGRVAGYPA